MKRQPYTECKLYYDGNARVEEGHYLRMPAGSAYWVQAIRRDRRRPYRVHLRCLRWPVEEIPSDAVVHPLFWYPRSKRRPASIDRRVRQ